MSESKTSKRRLEAAAKQRQALSLRQAGVTYADIADRLGYAASSGAYKAVMAALDKTLQEPADELRRVELARLDRLQSSVWLAATGGDMTALDRILKIMERRARLMGLDAPVKIGVNITVLSLVVEITAACERIGESPSAIFQAMLDELSGVESNG